MFIVMSGNELKYDQNKYRPEQQHCGYSSVGRLRARQPGWNVQLDWIVREKVFRLLKSVKRALIIGLSRILCQRVNVNSLNCNSIANFAKIHTNTRRSLEMLLILWIKHLKLMGNNNNMKRHFIWKWAKSQLSHVRPYGYGKVIRSCTFHDGMVTS